MAFYQNFDDQDVWGTSNDVSGLYTIGLTEQCLQQNLKDSSDGFQLDTLLSDVNADNFSNSWSDDFLFDGLTSSTAHHQENVKDYHLLSQSAQNIVLDKELDQSDTFQQPENSSSEVHLQVPSAAQPIYFQQIASPSVNLDSKKSIVLEVISSNVGLGLDELAAGPPIACQGPNTSAVALPKVLHGRPTSKASLNPAEAGKKAPRRKRNNHPKVKLYERSEPFSDEEEEKKRLNAVKAHKNRQRHSTEIGKLKMENEELKKRLQEQDRLLQKKDDEIKAFFEAQKQKNKALINLQSEISKLITN